MDACGGVVTVMGRAMLCLAAAAGGVLMHNSAAAAVRVCHDTILSEIVSGTSEQAAKKAALDQWRAKARVLGIGYDGWHVAAGKALKCFVKDGGYECLALGRPCVIQHNPNQRPSGADRKGQPL